MHAQRNPISGHLRLIEGKRGHVWHAKLRKPILLADGRTVTRDTHEKIGPVWKGAGRPPAGHYTRRTAEAWLAARLVDLRRGVGVEVETATTFREAAEEWFRHGETERDWKPSTRRDYRSALDVHLLPAFGELRLEEITTRAIERWRAAKMAEGKLPRRTAIKMLAILHGVFQRGRKLYGLPANPATDVERLRERYVPEEYDFYSPEEVWALVRAAASEQDGAVYLAAAFTGMRMGELLAQRVRDVDFEAEAIRVMTSYDHRSGIGTTKGGRGRTVPMVPEVARALAKLLSRDRFTGPDDPVFPSETGGYLDGSALRRRYREAQARAELRPLRFHDLRHTFGSLGARSAESARELQEWLGHADARTTARYMHYKSRGKEAQRLAGAFRVAKPDAEAAEVER